MTPERLETMEVNDQRRLETIVLTQVRDSLALINANLTKLDDNVRSINDKVVGLLASRYDEQIQEMKDETRQYRIDQAAKQLVQENRFIEHDRQIVRLGIGMAIGASIASASMAGVIALVISKILGAH